MRESGERIVSVDILRGLTMLVMIFVNDVSGVKGLPWWTYHMPPGKNGMTYVDMVFPFFLFVVGMSLPLSVRSRLEKGASAAQLWWHILARSFSLVVIGIFLANWSKLDVARTGMSRGVWATAGLLAAILLWGRYPKGRTVLKWVGLAALVVLFAMFRRVTRDGHTAWLDFRYWEILGLIGHSYLAACLLYVPLRKVRWAPFALVAGLTALSVASRLGWTPFLRGLPYWAWPFDRGELPSIIMAGVAASAIFLDKRIAHALREKMAWGLGYAAALFAAGRALEGFGISKLGATPSWCLYCSGGALVMFMAMYWLADVKGFSAWAAPLKPAGSNTLLTYLLPDLWYALGIGAFLPAALGAGWPGVAKSLLFTAMILGISALLTRARVRMQL